MLANAHYINATSEPLEADVRINLWSVPGESVVAEVGNLFWYDLFISVPPLATSEARMACTVAQPIHLLSLSSHMHRRGVGFDARITSGGTTASDPLFETDTWQDVPNRSFDPALQIAAGTTIEFGCKYDNPEDRHVLQGLTTEDEMCALVGSYYPRDPVMELCALFPGPAGMFRAATWIGSGTATCTETLSCFSNVTAGDRDGGTAECIRQSCPGAARALSDVIRCTYGAGDPLFGCGAAYQACQEATC